MTADLTLLDNPVWNALGSRQRRFALGGAGARKFPASVLPFVGLIDDDYRLLENILQVTQPGEEIFVKEGTGPMPLPWDAVSSVACLQMICPAPLAEAPSPPDDIRMMNGNDNQELIALVNQVQPGYFREETFLLGDYYGIRRDGKLVAVAGQRLKLPGLTEISAVCTHPDYTGKGFAQSLMRQLCGNVFASGDMPFLHVAASNMRAIGLYESLGFRTRRDITFAKLKFPE